MFDFRFSLKFNIVVIAQSILLFRKVHYFLKFASKKHQNFDKEECKRILTLFGRPKSKHRVLIDD